MRPVSEYLYHGTTTGSLAGIRERGLRPLAEVPGLKANRFYRRRMNFFSDGGGVFLAEQEVNARRYAFLRSIHIGRLMKNPGRPVLLRVRTESVSSETIWKDRWPLENGQWVVQGVPIRAEDIEVLAGQTWVPLQEWRGEETPNIVPRSFRIRFWSFYYGYLTFVVAAMGWVMLTVVMSLR